MQDRFGVAAQMPTPVDAEVRDIVAEFDRRIATILRQALRTPKRTTEKLVEAAQTVQVLLNAREVWCVYGHRAGARDRYSKGTEVS